MLYSFKGGSDGWAPFGGLVAIKDVLYGTTSDGLACQQRSSRLFKRECGTIFAITRTGTETVLHNFSGPPDGAEPIGSMTVMEGRLYGSTWVGGRGPCKNGCGTFFSAGTSGKKRTLYSFKGPPDGENPGGGLIRVGKLFYGTTASGGNGKVCGTSGCGTVFSITASGKERILYSFRGGRDAAGPNGGLALLNGKLYGTAGGGDYCVQDFQCGTIFEVTTSGQERVLHRFTGSPDGEYPNALVAQNGVLYGTTDGGGTYQYGTAFSLSP